MVARLWNIVRSEKSLVLLDQAIVSGGNFVVSILLARAMGVELFGKYSVVWLLFFLFLSVVQAFVIQPLYTLGNKRFAGDATYLPILQTINVSLIVVCVAVFFPILYLMGYGGGLLIFQLSALFFYLINQSLRGVGFYKQARVKVLMSDAIIQVGLVTCILVFEIDLNTLFLLLTIFYSASIPLYGNLVKLKFSRDKIKEVVDAHFTFSKWLLVTAGVQWLSGNYLILMADALLGHAVTGVIRIIQNTLGVFNILLQAMENYVPLKASYIFKQEGLKSTFRFVRHVGTYVFLLMLGGLVVFYFFYEKILLWCYQITFTNHELIFLFCILYVFILGGFLLRFLIRTLELNFAIFFGYILSTILVFLTANPLISHWGITGVVIGFLITQIVSIAVYIFYIQKTVQHENSTYHIGKE